MKSILKYFALLLAAAMVFGLAKLLDRAPWSASDLEVQKRAETAAVAETLPEESEAPQVMPEPVQTQAPTEEPEERFLLTLTGNTALGCRDAHAYAGHSFRQTIGEDYGYPFRNVLPFLEEDELTLLNLEGVFYDAGWQQDKPSIRGPASYINILSQSSVEAVTLASDHAMQFGQKGYDSTVAALEDAGIQYAERDKTTLITSENGLTVGIYSSLYYKQETEKMVQAIRELDEQADLVIFAPHWTFSLNGTPGRAQVEMAHSAIDAGADIVWGSHPQVLQPMETYNGGLIFYSLGNFSFGGDMTPDDYDAAIIRQEVIRGADGAVSLGETTVIPVCISSVADRNNYQPTAYETGSEGYVRVLEKLAFAEKN